MAIAETLTTTYQQVTPEAILEAHLRNQLPGAEVRPTQIIECPELARELGAASVHFASELGQRSGAYKDRGTENFMETRPECDLGKDVAAASRGNHAKALAHSARVRGLQAALFVPEGTPALNISVLEAFDNVSVTQVGKTVDEAIVVAERHSEEHKKLLVPPFDHSRVIVGQGTLGFEVLFQLPKTNAVLTPAGGCGFSAGMVTAIQSINPETYFVCAEPAGAASLTHAFVTNQADRGLDTIDTFADGAAVCKVGTIPYQILFRQRKFLDVVTVDTMSLRRSVTELWENHELKVEVAAALGYAASRQVGDRLRGKHVVIPLTGGSLSQERYEREVKVVL